MTVVGQQVAHVNGLLPGAWSLPVEGVTFLCAADMNGPLLGASPLKVRLFTALPTSFPMPFLLHSFFLPLKRAVARHIFPSLLATIIPPRRPAIAKECYFAYQKDGLTKAIHNVSRRSVSKCQCLWSVAAEPTRQARTWNASSVARVVSSAAEGGKERKGGAFYTSPAHKQLTHAAAFDISSCKAEQIIRCHHGRALTLGSPGGHEV
ncbi:uncharacterized protein IWZ02DRAFT_104317 [Phyllosticta citriasiana]|uniref:uncharacterized protein n=1 Tax=Phyllosticta citriasiana TaxID=595635 RepID=UPI0030FDCCCF